MSDKKQAPFLDFRSWRLRPILKVMKRTQLLPIGFFIVCLCVGLWVNQRSWNGMVYVYVGEHRAPAAVRSMSDYSAIDHMALNRTAQAQLMAYAQVLKDGGQLGLQLGHPILTTSDGGRSFGCQVADHSGAYDRIQLTFVGTGISEGGEAPKMVIDADCRSEKNLNQLETIWIPMDDVLRNASKDQTFDLGGENQIQLSFESMPSQWPENWVMWSVKFYKEEAPDEGYTLDASLLKQARAQLLSFDWKVPQ